MKLVVADFVVSILWVVAGALVRVVTQFDVLQLKRNGDLVKLALTAAAMFMFTWIGKLTNGATYNPITVLLNSLGAKPLPFFTLAVRILAQALGSLVGVMCVNILMPRGVQGGPLLKVGVKNGMITEGILTFTIVMVALMVNTRGPKGFFLKTWIVTLSKLCLSILGADFTGPAMNPATVSMFPIL
ncbi:hypothetical protein KI387_039869 [Taxus chinensis]|uniref:Uncharacterized protein n=1 Tax=Taxus chinensis TaxID=29808 RepID=A0AA38CBI1_TAXCH|nr:hypothetical protein KI387_039869 [Taxus chinensis]